MLVYFKLFPYFCFAKRFYHKSSDLSTNSGFCFDILYTVLFLFYLIFGINRKKLDKSKKKWYSINYKYLKYFKKDIFYA